MHEHARITDVDIHNWRASSPGQEGRFGHNNTGQVVPLGLVPEVLNCVLAWCYGLKGKISKQKLNELCNVSAELLTEACDVGRPVQRTTWISTREEQAQTEHNQL